MKKTKFPLGRKQFIALFLILIAIFAYGTWVGMEQYDKAALTNEDFLRFHVVANSDSKEDQELKEKVRDGLLERINDGLALEAMSGVKGDDSYVTLDMEKSKEYITENLTELEGVARDIIRDAGFDYDAKAFLGVKWIPRKTYGNITFPAGNYQALNITIGKGAGKNWWCVLFPPLCLIGAEVPWEMNDYYKDAIGTDKYREIVEAAGGNEKHKLKLKFKTLEMF
ncbi:MAG: stage II sporulation protein R [Anaerovoracaceae bacterium]